MFKRKLINIIFTFLFVIVSFISFPQGVDNFCGAITINKSCPNLIEKVYKSIFNTNANKFQTKETNVFVDISGYPCGFSLKSDGVIVVSLGEVYTKTGYVQSPLKGFVNPGDVIQRINNECVYSGEDIISEINKPENLQKELKVEYITKSGENKCATIKAIYDEYAYGYRLGLWVRNNAVGVGTITYLKNENFFALGHPVVDQECKTIIPPKNGEIYKCTIMGVQKGEKGVPGELKGLFVKGSNNVGEVLNNNKKGLYGKIKSELKDEFVYKKNVMVADKEEVKIGNAVIVSTIDGSIAKEYSIEIIRTNYNSKKNGSCMVIRITDEELLRQTGGIVQGMSGSPILQNGKLVGCVTHVFINDPTRGFANYIEEVK